MSRWQRLEVLTIPEEEQKRGKMPLSEEDEWTFNCERFADNHTNQMQDPDIRQSQVQVQEARPLKERNPEENHSGMN
jgi:hypothetical protein